jgi:hypothetical protein
MGVLDTSRRFHLLAHPTSVLLIAVATLRLVCVVDVEETAAARCCTAVGKRSVSRHLVLRHDIVTLILLLLFRYRGLGPGSMGVVRPKCGV